MIATKAMKSGGAKSPQNTLNSGAGGVGSGGAAAAVANDVQTTSAQQQFFTPNLISNGHSASPSTAANLKSRERVIVNGGRKRMFASDNAEINHQHQLFGSVVVVESSPGFSSPSKTNSRPGRLKLMPLDNSSKKLVKNLPNQSARAANGTHKSPVGNSPLHTHASKTTSDHVKIKSAAVGGEDNDGRSMIEKRNNELSADSTITIPKMKQLKTKEKLLANFHNPNLLFNHIEKESVVVAAENWSHNDDSSSSSISVSSSSRIKANLLMIRSIFKKLKSRLLKLQECEYEESKQQIQNLSPIVTKVSGVKPISKSADDVLYKESQSLVLLREKIAQKKLVYDRKLKRFSILKAMNEKIMQKSAAGTGSMKLSSRPIHNNQQFALTLMRERKKELLERETLRQELLLHEVVQCLELSPIHFNFLYNFFQTQNLKIETRNAELRDELSRQIFGLKQATNRNEPSPNALKIHDFYENLSQKQKKEDLEKFELILGNNDDDDDDCLSDEITTGSSTVGTVSDTLMEKLSDSSSDDEFAESVAAAAKSTQQPPQTQKTNSNGKQRITQISPQVFAPTSPSFNLNSDNIKSAAALAEDHHNQMIFSIEINGEIFYKGDSVDVYQNESADSARDDTSLAAAASGIVCHGRILSISKQKIFVKGADKRIRLSLDELTTGKFSLTKFPQQQQQQY